MHSPMIIHFYAPAMTMAGALSVIPVHSSVHHTYDVLSISQIVLIRNWVALLSTKMSFSSSIMVHIEPCLQELLPIIPEKSFLMMPGL